MRQNTSRRILSLLLVLVMVVGLLPMSVFAAGTGTSGDPFIVYRNPTEDPAGASLSLLEVSKFRVRDDTYAKWIEMITKYTNADENSSVQYWVDTFDNYQSVGGLTGLYFGYHAVKNKTAATDTEIVIINNDRDTVYSVKVKSYVDVTYDVKGTKTTDKIILENRIADSEKFKAAQTAAFAWADEHSNESVKYEFVGWDTNGDGVEDEAFIGDTIDVCDGSNGVRVAAEKVDGLTYVAVFSEDAITYNVTFDADNGTEDVVVEVEGGKTVEEPTAPTKEGYDFGGWFNGEEEFDFDTVITEDITLTAQWIIQTYTVTFDANGADTEAPDAIEDVEYGSTITEPTAPTKDGYNFDGWFIGDTETKWNFGTDKVTDDITLKAKWTEIGKHLVSFDYGDYTGTQDYTVEVKDGDTVGEPTAPVWDEYHQFLGWFEEDAEEAFDFDTPITENVYLTAKWQDNSVAVTFDPANGEDEIVVTVVSGETVTAPEDPTKEDSIFAGWFEEDAEEAFDFETTVTEEITLTAKWLPDVNNNGVDDTLESFTVVFTEADEDNKCESSLTVPDAEVIDDNTYLYDSTENPNGVSFSVSTQLTDDDYFISISATKNGADAADADYIAAAGDNWTVTVTVSAKEIIDTKINAGDVTAAYGTSAESIKTVIGAAVVVADETEALVGGAEAVTYEPADLGDLDAGEHTVTISYAGGEKDATSVYGASSTTVTVTVTKADAVDVTVESAVIHHSDAAEVDVDELIDAGDLKTIKVVAGADVHDETKPVALVQIEIPGTETILAFAGGSVTLNFTEFKALLDAIKTGDYADIDPTLALALNAIGADKFIAAAKEIGINANTVETLLSLVENVSATLNKIIAKNPEINTDPEIKIQLVSDLKTPTNIGAYLIGAVTIDPNYASSVGLGYRIITPNGIKAELQWVYEDENYIFTPVALENEGILDAEVTAIVDGTEDNYDASITEAQEHVEYIFVGYNEKNGATAFYNADSLTEYGVYTQIAFIANWDNNMYYAEPIVRPFIYAPNAADVSFIDENGNPNNLRLFDYDGSSHALEAEVTVGGEVITPDEGELTITYYGVDGHGNLVNGTTEAPTEAGAYVVIAIYKDSEDGTLAVAGADVAVMVIDKIDGEFALKDTTVPYDGSEHFAEIDNPTGYDDYITIAIDRANNIAYVNVYGDLTSKLEEYYSKLPESVQQKIDELLAEYEFDGDVQTSTIKNLLTEALAELGSLTEEDLAAAADALIEEVKAILEEETGYTVDELKAAIEAKLEEIKAEVTDRIKEEINARLPEELVDTLGNLADQLADAENAEAVEELLKSELNTLLDETGLPAEVINQLKDLLKDILDELNAGELIADVENKINETIESIETQIPDAETLVKAMVGALAGVIDTEDVKALLTEAIDKAEQLSVFEEVETILAGIESITGISADVSADDLIAQLKSAIEKLEGIESTSEAAAALKSALDKVVEKLEAYVAEIPEGTVVFGKNPTEIGTYDCYALTYAANYKSVFTEAELVITCGNGKHVEGKTEVIHGTPATCLKGGLTDGLKCTKCGEIITEREEIEPLGHDWGEWETVKKPTYTENGLKRRVCKRDESHVDEYILAKLTRPADPEKPEDDKPFIPPYFPVITTTPNISVGTVPAIPSVENLNYTDHVAYIIGYDDGTVRPEDDITRAEAATIFFRLMTDEARDAYWSTSNDFVDVADDAWYNIAVSTLDAAGVIVDSDDGYFRPDEPITRAELAVLAAQFCTEDAYFKNSSFEDVSRDHWAAAEIALIEDMGWIEGFNGKFRPDDSITRAETVTVINRMLHRAVKEANMIDGMITFSDNDPSDWYYEAIQEAANSHSYNRTAERVEGVLYRYEKWTRLLKNPNWAEIEQYWAEKNGK